MMQKDNIETVAKIAKPLGYELLACPPPRANSVLM